MIRVAYFLGTHEDWGGGSRALLNFIRAVDRQAVHPIVVLTKEGNLSAELQSQSIEYRCLPNREISRNIFISARWVIEATRFLRKNAVDLIHVNYSTVGWKPAVVLGAKLNGIPVVYHYHGRVNTAGPFVKHAALVIMVSDYIKEQSDTSGVPTRTVHNIVDLERFGSGEVIRKELDIANEAVVVTFIGQVKLIKGIKTFLNAISNIPNPNVRFLIAGEFREASNDLTRDGFDSEISKDDRIMYLGYRPDIQDLYQTSDVIVMPSLYDEPCAMVLFETAAARKPIVASATGGTPEVIQNGINGFLFERDNARELARAITTLVENKDLRVNMGLRAYETALTNFSKKPVERLEAVYKELMS
jgi:glycosyltransferase involved in cell wall biosynthesis